MTEKEIKEATKLSGTKELDFKNIKVSGEFIKTKSGTTHYEIKGEGEVIVLVHGYATPYFIYDKLFNRFVNEGYNVIRYDLFGRGYSERVDTDYTPAFFSTQLKELVDALIPNESFYLVGTSMGGGIVTTYYMNNKERVKGLILLAPAGMDTFKAPLYMKICKIRGLGDFIFNNIAGKMLLKKCASELYNVGDDEKDYYMRSFADAFQYKGFLRCTLSSLRNTILNTNETMKGYRAVAENNAPMLVIWGTIDKTMPYYQSERMTEVCKNAKLITYENSGHIFLFDEGERTSDDILRFIRG